MPTIQRVWPRPSRVEQTAAIDALTMLGGLGAADALARIIADEVVQGPGLRGAVSAAARLRARLPADVVIALLRHTEPAIRADVCRCVDRYPPAIPMLIDLLGDLHRAVATDAACALRRMGRAEARRSLTRLLREAPSADVIAAIASIADEECIVLLGRLARSTSKLATDAREVLEGIDDPRAGDATCGQQGAGRRLGCRSSGRAELARKQQLLHGHQDSLLIFLLGRGPMEFIVEIKLGIRKLGPDLRVCEPYKPVLKLR